MKLNDCIGNRKEIRIKRTRRPMYRDIDVSDFLQANRFKHVQYTKPDGCEKQYWYNDEWEWIGLTSIASRGDNIYFSRTGRRNEKYTPKTI